MPAMPPNPDPPVQPVPLPPVQPDPPVQPVPAPPVPPDPPPIPPVILSPAVSWILLGIVAVAVLFGCIWRPCHVPGKWWFIETRPIDPILMWYIFMFFLVAFCVVSGKGIKKRWNGLLIDERNKISLSRFQLVMWTILLVSGLLTVYLVNLCLGVTEPLSVVMDEQLWALMGISGTSLVASGLIKSNKRNQETSKAENEKLSAMSRKATDSQKEATATEMLVGRSVENVEPKDASFLDMFMGEDIGNKAWLDMGKVQMFVFTLVIWFTYATALGHKIFMATHHATKIDEFPSLSGGAVALLAISHASYLATKSLPPGSGSGK